MDTRFSLGQFLKRYKNDDACLDEIFKLRYPDGVNCGKCKKITKYYKITGRTAYSCEFCRTQIFPLAGTIFEKTTTPLRLWFYAMFLMVQTRSGISAKQLQRELGVTYKTAWRMFKQIRMLMAETGGGMLDGVVEIDETFVGGKGKNRAYVPNFNEKPKEIVMGMVQREGRAYFRHIPNTGKWTLLAQIQEHVDPTAHVMTDEWGGYIQLPKFGYKHDSVRHGASNYVTGLVHTNTVEGFWSIFKRGVYGGKMYDELLKQVAEVKLV